MIAHDYLGVVLACVSTTGFLASSSSGDSLDGTLEKIAELEGLNEVPICVMYSSVHCLR